MTRFKRQFDPKYKGSQGKKMDGKSMTTPDMSVSIQTLLERHSRGLGLGSLERHGEYFDDVEIPIFDDITDQVAYKEELIRRTQEVDEQIRKEREEKRKAESPPLSEEKSKKVSTPQKVEKPAKEGFEQPSEASKDD